MKQKLWVVVIVGVITGGVAWLSAGELPDGFPISREIMVLVGQVLVGVATVLGAFRAIQEFIFKQPSNATVINILPQSTEVPHPPHGSIPPPNVETYIDRGQIENHVRQNLGQPGVTAIVGLSAPGGVGKTELAKRAAAELRPAYPGFLWVDVGAKTPYQVVIEMLSLCNARLDGKESYELLVQKLRTVLGLQPTLVILDDVRSTATGVLRDFLPPPPGAALVTSRLRDLAAIPAGKTLALDNLDPAQSRQLLAALLGEARLEGEPGSVQTLIDRCLGNPLALDIAGRAILQFEGFATPIGLFVNKILASAGQLRVGDDPRHNLFAVIDASYGELSEEERRWFDWLAAFDPSGFAPNLALNLWDTPAQGEKILERLLNLSLLKRAPGWQGNSERLRLHDFLHDFATDKLEQRGETALARQKQAELMVELFEQHYADDPSSAPEVASELDNLRQAAAWAFKIADRHLLAQLATRPRNWLLNVFNITTEWMSWLEEALKGDTGDRQLQANTLKAIGDVQQFRDERDAALESYRQALALFKAVGSKLGEANTLQAIGDVQQFRKDNDAALESYRQALALFKAVGSKLGEANTLKAIGDVQQFRDERDAALESYRQALALYKAVGDRLGEANTLKAIGDVQQFRDERDAALESYRQALALFKAVGSKLGEANTMVGQGKLALIAGKQAQADQLLEQAVTIYRLIGDRYSVPAQTGNYGWALWNSGQKELARPYLLRAAALFDEIGMKDFAARHRKAANS